MGRLETDNTGSGGKLKQGKENPASDLDNMIAFWNICPEEHIHLYTRFFENPLNLDQVSIILKIYLKRAEMISFY